MATKKKCPFPDGVRKRTPEQSRDPSIWDLLVVLVGGLGGKFQFLVDLIE
jgi:hypothetical protein